MYDLEAMKNAVKRCDVNIKTFEDAIDKELKNKKEYQRIIRALEERKDK